MVLIIKKMWKGLNYALQEYSHPRTRSWFLANPLPVFLILVLWLYFCLYAGPRVMKTRKPFELRKTILMYNFMQICISVFLFYEGAVHGYLAHYSFHCQPLDYTNDPREDYIATLTWCYLVSKLSELLDTVFFVLRKKSNQITTLHIFHHTIMPIAASISVTFLPGGHGMFVGWINTFIHIIMYSYYLVAGLGPQYQKYLWWKRHLTALQLIQFCLIFWHNFSVLFRDCAYPKTLNCLVIIESLVFIHLFGSFYFKSYLKNSKKKDF